MKKTVVVFSLVLLSVMLFAVVPTAQAAVLAVISQPLPPSPSPGIYTEDVVLGQSFEATATGVITTIQSLLLTYLLQSIDWQCMPVPADLARCSIHSRFTIVWTGNSTRSV
ncbi:MAG: hypothetical protein JXB07_01670 [Anaerolineae bacterium]|nr:hypothetical protein [Anaerolineae bacterium]